MRERELNIVLREMAREKGLCDDWYGQWGDDSSIDECLDRYVRGFDFAVKNDYPSLEFCRANFDREDLHRHNIYIDEDIDLLVHNGYYVLLGACRASVIAEGPVAVTVYCRHDSDVEVVASGGARVFVTCYDASHGRCGSVDEISKVKIYNRNIK